MREPEFLSSVVATLVQAVADNDLNEGAVDTTFSPNTKVNVVMFGKNTLRLFIPHNAKPLIRLARTSGYCMKLATANKSDTPSRAARVRVNPDTEGMRQVVGYIGELTTGTGVVGVITVATAQEPSSNSHFYDEGTGKTVRPVILRAADYAGLTRVTVGDVTYEVVGVWDSYDLVAYSEA